MNAQLEKFLEHVAYNVRVSSLLMTTNAGSGHPTSALSEADILSALFFYAMHFDPQDPGNPNNDRFILSKGHAIPGVYAIWKELGVLTQEDLLGYRHYGSVLEGHPTPRFSRNEAATGSLGQGLSIGVGMALAARMDKRSYKTFVLLGDSEVAEGQIWEALELAAYYKLNNLIAILDCNRLGQSTATIEGHDLGNYTAKFNAFGWRVYEVNGHSMHDLIKTFDEINNLKGNNQPIMVIAKTYKGYGVDKAEDKEGFHGKVFSKDELPEILTAMQKRFAGAAQPVDYIWLPQLPKEDSDQHAKNPLQNVKSTCMPPQPMYTLGQKVATRLAYGQALAELGGLCPQLVALDAEVKNSTFAEIFAQQYPERFVQSFIAEQNMVSMAVGLAARGKVPFVSTFSSFFTRAFDQIRMAAIGRAPLRLVGSHCGVSIGQDGPSQMGLEDIAMMRAIPNSVIFYPCDAVSTHLLMNHMVNRTEGITYLRTTRMATPVIYAKDAEFRIGGCKVLRESDNDQLCIVAAGVTVFQALEAYEQLRAQGIAVAVIDLYCVKPLDHETLLRVACNAQGKVITVEDHYVQGGLGQAVAFALRNTAVALEALAVTKIPQSGTPEELLKAAGIDAAAIVSLAYKMK